MRCVVDGTLESRQTKKNENEREKKTRHLEQVIAAVLVDNLK